MIVHLDVDASNCLLHEILFYNCISHGRIKENKIKEDTQMYDFGTFIENLD